jgi:hypothetical protein
VSNTDDNDLKEQLRALQHSGPRPRDGFTDAVMQQVALRRKPKTSRSLFAALFAPRTITLRFRISQLLAAGGLWAVAALVGVRSLVLLRSTPVQHAVVAPGPTAQPVRVRFALVSKSAQNVSLAGDFNGWRTDTTPLQRGADGVWTVTVPLEPGSWSYSFVVDGVFVEDPLAETYRADGFGGRNAIVRVGG